MERMNQIKERSCRLCGRHADAVQLIPADIIRPAVAETIKKSCPDWSTDGFICVDDLNRYRYEYVSSLVEDEKGELTDLEKEVLESMNTHEILSVQTDQEFETHISFGQRLSDQIARFGGSWKFIPCSAVF